MIMSSVGDRLPVSAGAYIAEHGVGAVSAAVRRWVAHPPSVRRCGVPRSVVVPVVWSSGRRPSFGSLSQCHNRFVDPYCSWWWRARAAESVAAVLAYGRSVGLVPVSVVLTVSHQRRDSLGDVLAIANKSWSRLTTKRGWRGVNPIWLRALDVVVGGANGPHPHYNVVMLVPSGADISRFAYWLSDAWLDSVKLSHVRRFDLRAAGVIGVDVQELRTVEDERRWAGYALKDLCVESKLGFEVFENRYRTSTGGHTLMELACLAHGGNDSAGRLLAACSVDLAGKRSYTTSKSWKQLAELAGIALVEEDADADLHFIQIDDRVLALVPAPVWSAHRADFEAWRDGRDWSLVRSVGVVVDSLRELVRRLGIEEVCSLFADPPVVDELPSAFIEDLPDPVPARYRFSPGLPASERSDPDRVPVVPPVQPPVKRPPNRARSKRARRARA